MDDSIGYQPDAGLNRAIQKWPICPTRHSRANIGVAPKIEFSK
jgi:hypothetical protein